MNCATCHYCENDECRARPPVVITDDEGELSSMFPPVLPDWWCGDWSASKPLPWPFMPVLK